MKQGKIEMGNGLKTMLIVVLVIILVGLGVFFLGRYMGKKSQEKGDRGTIPKETDWDTPLTTEEETQAKNHAEALYKDMKGLNWRFRDTKIYSSYLAVSDKVFVATATYFNDKYGDDGNLAEWIKDEDFGYSSLEAKKLANSILERLEKFGIKA